MPNKLLISITLAFVSQVSFAQISYPVNGVADVRNVTQAFVHATVYQDADRRLNDATIIVRKGVITAVGTGIKLPADAVVIDCKGKFIYPSFIDAYSDYGLEAPARPVRGFDWNAPAQLATNTKGPYGWNQAIRSDVDAYRSFTSNDAKAKPLRDLGFGTVLTHIKDGIARGTGALVTLASTKENLTILKEKASSNFSFSKGTSTQSYPTSLMGSIALLRQTFLDGRWYKTNPKDEGLNLSLRAWNDNLGLPMIFEAEDKWNDLRADRIGDEFGYQFIIKGGGNEFERIDDVKKTNAAYILPVNFPKPPDVEKPEDARFIDLATLKYWEMAPLNPGAFEKAGVTFCLTPAGLTNLSEFRDNLRRSFVNGLSQRQALMALTSTPARMLNVYDKVGSLDAGKVANFLVLDGPIFGERSNIIYNYIQGEKYIVKDETGDRSRGYYTININGPGGSKSYTINVKGASSADVYGKDTMQARYSGEGQLMELQFAETKKAKEGYRLTGIRHPNQDWSGTGTDSLGNAVTWNAQFTKTDSLPSDSSKKNITPSQAKLQYPNMAYGFTDMPKQGAYLLRNGTVWTNENEGILQNADVLINNGKIVAVGKNLNANGATVIDASGKHITTGIIDEHSHIAAAVINEGGQSVTSEVRIADVLRPDDINIYRQLSGGVTTSHILHGSANTIGGQTQLIKLRWGTNDDGLKFKGADPFIKFALGENVKRTPSPSNNRFPDTRMGVEQVQMDAFTRASDYRNALRGKDAANVRRDLELDALVEIMEAKRFITCHSYVQSEILETMKIAERFGFKINTFTHILEGYKVAPQMKAHGAAASTFSDWWAYKLEVQDAIPYNPGLMQKAGLNVAINSDDAEMARRLNQEASKSVRYMGMSEEDAFKMVTLNPAKMLHIDNQVGSLKAGKDADVVLWSDNPLSIYAKAEKTFVDGVLYFDRDRDTQLRKDIFTERNRIIKKILDEKKGGRPVGPPTPSYKTLNFCEDHEHSVGLLIIENEEFK